MNAREEVLDRIRAANRRAGAVTAVPVDRSYRRNAGPQAHEVIIDLLIERLDDYRAGVTRTDANGLPAAITALVHGKSTIVPVGLPEVWLPGATRDEPESGAATVDRFDAVVTAATVACAETGTIVLSAGPAEGRRMLSLVPDHHVCVVHLGQVVATVPEMIAALDPNCPLTFISGPSATSDIELERVEGVHGPRRFDVILVDGETPPYQLP